MHERGRFVRRARARVFILAAAGICVALLSSPAVRAGREFPRQQDGAADSSAASLDHARQLFYSGLYPDASAAALAIRTHAPDNLATYELRTSAIHFQIRRALGEPADKDKAFKACAECGNLMKVFLEDTTAGRQIARARVEKAPADVEALFFLGKIDLNYVWLQLGTLGKRTGWNEYREARRSLDEALKLDPRHTRARVARAWIDYIVDTRVTWAFRWILGGGDKKKGLAVMHEVSANTTDRFERTEALFGLWEMSIREKKFDDAVAAARILAADFPENRELAKFLAARAAPTGSVKK